MGKKFTDEDLKLLLDQGLSQAEIARKVGVSEQAVSWRVKRLRTKQASQDQDLSTILDESKSSESNTSLKDQLTAKELKFLEIYLSGEYTIEKAMIAAGYVNYHQNSLYRLGRKIVQKYESQAPDHRKIMREVGLGIVKVSQKMMQAMDKAKSETVQFQHTQLAARALGMTGDISQSSQGVTVIIQAQKGAATQVNVGPQAPTPTDPGYAHPTGTPGKPIQIFK